MSNPLSDWVYKLAGKSQKHIYAEDLDNDICPLCAARDQIRLKAEAGLTQNVVCTNCNALFWVGLGEAKHLGFENEQRTI